ncbi:MAG TPA: YkgJ family cysteine cluster protein [Polyangiaceae bacterium]|nr:YkgJ family cysteine cluster protein [Polyangiaceae bacterium]
MKQRSRKAERAALERQRQKDRAFRDDAGRVHLTMHRDPVTGRERVGLKSRIFDSDWQNELVVSAANTVLAALGQRPTLERVVDVTRRAMASTSELIAGLLARAPAGALACKAGCDHCCYQVVGVTAAEVLTIFEHLQRTRSAEERERIRARARQSYERGRGLSSAERFSPEHPCVFLEGGACSIYEVRPLSCRGMNSLDAAECEARLRDPAEWASFLAKGHGGRSYVEPIQAFRAISAGLQLGLAELYRLDVRPLDLTAAVHALFESGASLGSAWISGQKPFESALRTSG